MALSPYPIDTTPSNVATSALQNLPFNNLIGGPLNAAVQAQAQAAKTTVDFINQVCLNTDANGQKSAVTVTFSYQDGYGFLRTLTVPLITILPIPYIAVNEIDIDFKANISASSATSTSNSDEENMSAGGSVNAKIGWGVFSADLQFNASYSSKKDSKATQDSKYSVEYTMDVAVKAGSTDLPAGLARVLNILSDGITMKTSQSSGQLNALGVVSITGKGQAPLHMTLVGNDGNPLASTITPTFTIASTPDGVFTLGTVTPITDAPGVFTLPLTSTVDPAAQTAYPLQVTATWTDANGNSQTVTGTANVTVNP